MNSINTCENEIECSKIAYFSCYHCSKNLCLEHLNKHNILNIVRVQELSNKLDEFVNLVSNLDTQKISQNAHDKLDIWKKQISNDIENIYKLYLNEINYLEIELNQRLNIVKEDLRLKISNLGTQLLTIQNIDEISQQQLLPIEYDLKQFHQFFESVQCELNIDTKNISIKDLINVYNVFSYKRTLPNNTQLESYRTLSVENMKKFISSKNNESILWIDTSKQLHYIDRNFHNHLLSKY
ncbi:unnamed protein product [Rotaria sordida]|uniref:Uncharacterized protein n=1 Tax=Rotaria sordida TaxID=392033 RepID=A0A819PEG8_9BILA|nr:unnamed protein product [Rotaria sordida]